MRQLFLSIISASLLIIGCDTKSTEDNVSGTDTPIKLNKQLILVDGEKDIAGSINIISGNGNYSIVFPKKINVDGNLVPFSSDVYSISIKDDNIIHAERKLLNKQYVDGLFLVIDSKRGKKLFAIGQAHNVGILYDFDALESRYLNDPDYWQD